MSNCTTECCNFIRGEVYLADAGANCSGSVSSILGCKGGSAPLRKIGNVDSLNIFIESEIRGLTSKTNFFDTLACAQTVINNVRVSLRINCIDEENLKLGLYGTDSSSSDSGSVSGEKLCGQFKKCYFLRTQKCGISNVVVEIKDELGNVVQTLVEDSDYKVDPFGIEFLTTFLIPDNQQMSVSYDYDESSYRSTQLLTEIKGPHTLYFKGVNLNGKTPYHVEIFNVVLQPATTLELISSDNFQSFELNGVVMRDCSRGTGLSQFMELKEGVSNDGCS